MHCASAAAAAAVTYSQRSYDSCFKSHDMVVYINSRDLSHTCQLKNKKTKVQQLKKLPLSETGKQVYMNECHH